MFQCVCVCVRACACVSMHCGWFQQHWWFVACRPAQRTHALAHVIGPHSLANNFATPVGCAPHLLAARSQTMPIRTYTAHMCLHKLLAHTCWRISRQLSSDGLPSTCSTCQQKTHTRSHPGNLFDMLRARYESCHEFPECEPSCIEGLARRSGPRRKCLRT